MKVSVEHEPPNLMPVARYRVIFADCDPMRIMYYGTYFRLFEIGRAELFRSLGHPFPEYVARGLYLGVVETHCRYHRPARYDDELVIRAGIVELGRARMEIGYVIEDSEGNLLASGSTGHAVLDERGKPQRIPAEFRVAAERSRDRSQISDVRSQSATSVTGRGPRGDS